MGMEVHAVALQERGAALLARVAEGGGRNLGKTAGCLRLIAMCAPFCIMEPLMGLFLNLL